MLQLTRFEAGHLEAHLQPLPITHFLRDLVDKINREWAGSDYCIILHDSPGESVVWADGTLLEREHPSLVLLDVSMPKLDGWETCRLIREISDVPIIMLTGRDEEADKARGLDLGADDYLTKPFGFVELEARIPALLRRAEMPSVKERRKSQLIFRSGGLVVDIAAHQVTLRGQPVALTPTEFRLLEHLLKHAGMVLTHSQLLTAAWGFAYGESTELLKPAISRLGQKVEEDPSHPTLIQTIHGIGYRLVLAPATPKSVPGMKES